MRHLLAAKSGVQQVKGFMPVELMETIIRANGYEVAEHRSWRFHRSMRAPGESRSQSIPDFGDFDSTRRFLMGEGIRLYRLTESTGKGCSYPWGCVLQYRDSRWATHDAYGYGHSPAFALIAAWLQLQSDRARLCI